MTDAVVIVAAKRTAVGSFLGSLSSVPAPKLGSAVISDLLTETGVSPDAVSEVIMGNVLTTGVGQNPARQAAIFAGLPVQTLSRKAVIKLSGMPHSPKPPTAMVWWSATISASADWASEYTLLIIIP